MTSRQSVLSPEQIEAIFNQLYPYTQVTEEVKQAHIQQINQRYNTQLNTATVTDQPVVSSASAIPAVKPVAESKPLAFVDEATDFFCPECGAAVESAAGNPVPTPQPVAKNHVNENTSGISNGGQRNKGLIYGIGAVLLVAALGGGFYFMNHSAGSDDSSVKIVKVAPKKDTKDKAEVPQKNADHKTEVQQSAGNNNQSATPQTNVPAVTKASIAGASHSSADKEGAYVHSALLTIDGDTKTCWAEGVQGYGIGENIVISFNSTYRVSGMNIWIGHQKTEELFYKNGRPLAVRIIGSDGSNEIYNLNDTIGVQRVNFTRPIDVSNIKIIVEKIAPGNKYEDTCIAEVSFF